MVWTFIELFFLLFAGITLVSAIGVITSSNSVKASLFLVLSFVSTAGIWLFLHAEFLAVILVLVYIGAVMILFLFVIMMLDINAASLRDRMSKYSLIGLLIGLVIFAEIVLFIINSQFEKTLNINVAEHIAIGSNTKEIGQLLFTEHLFSFELAALVLLVAMILALVLTIGNQKQVPTVYMDVAQQVKVRSKDRLKMIKMDPVKKKPTRRGD